MAINNLREARLRAGLSLRPLVCKVRALATQRGRACSVGLTTIGNCERGRRALEEPLAQLLSEVLQDTVLPGWSHNPHLRRRKPLFTSRASVSQDVAELAMLAAPSAADLDAARTLMSLRRQPSGAAGGIEPDRHSAPQCCGRSKEGWPPKNQPGE